MSLIEILRNPEGKTLEFKLDLSSREGVLRTVVAFANTAGGTLLIGVEDGTRHVRGVQDPLDLEERLANLISDGIAPRLMPELEILPWRRLQLVAVRVHPSPGRPHHLLRDGPHAGVYVRVGSTNRRADADMIDELRRFARGASYDEQPMPGLDADALDFAAVSRQFSGRREIRRRDLDTLRLLTLHQGRKVPTVGGMLLFGRDRAHHFPDAWLQAGRFAGLDKAHIVDHLDIRSYPGQAVGEAVAFVQKHSTLAADIGPVRRRERWSLPPLAVREAIINAVAHADYAQQGAPLRLSIFDDRMEVESPGLLPFGLTVEDLRQGVSRLRNRVIGRVFHELGLVEQWGSGIQRMTAACREAGLEPPALEELGNRFRVTLFLARGQAALARDEVDQAIMRIVMRPSGASTQEVADAIQRTPRATRLRLLRLVQVGLVREIGSGPKDPRRRYVAGEPP